MVISYLRVGWLCAQTTANCVILYMYAEGSLLCVSLTVNMCALSFFAWSKIVDYLGSKYSEKVPLIASVIELHRNKPWFIGKTLTELSAICTVIVLSVIALSTTSISGRPFSGNQTITIDPIVQTVVSANVGRYIYMSVQDGFLHQHLHNFRTDLIHHVVTTAAYVIFIAYRQNLFLSVAGLLMEMNLIAVEINRLMRELGMKKDSKLHFRVTAASCFVTLISRGMFPIIFMTLAFKHGTPFTMDIAPLTFFFLCIVFFFVINIWMMIQSVSRVVRYSSCGPGEVTDNQNYVTVTNEMEPQSRDVVLPDGHGDRHCITFSNLNYGYLKSYDNINMYNNADEKNNCDAKKTSKPTIIYKDPTHTENQTSLESGDNHVNCDGEVVDNRHTRTRVHFQDEVNEARTITTPSSPGTNHPAHGQSTRTSSRDVSRVVSPVPLGILRQSTINPHRSERPCCHPATNNNQTNNVISQFRAAVHVDLPRTLNSDPNARRNTKYSATENKP